MTHKENLAYVREKCIEANPEIVELKFGCEINMYGAPRVIVGSWAEDEEWLTVHKTDGGPQRLTKEMLRYSSHTKIVGRPIRLADVLLALHELPRTQNVAINTLVGTSMNSDFTKFDLAKTWDLRQDDLGKQSEETVAFLRSLL